jgi:hypothetical protein
MAAANTNMIQFGPDTYQFEECVSTKKPEIKDV